MPFGGADNPLGGLELGVQASEAPAQPPRPLVQVVADGNVAQQARIQTEAAHQAQEEPEKSRAEILVAVQTEWDYFGQVPKNDQTAENVTDILVAYQAERQAVDPDYVLGKKEKLEKLTLVVQQGLEIRQTDKTETSEVANKIEERSVKEEIDAEKKEAVVQTDKSLKDYQDLLASPELKGLSNTQRIAALLKPENIDKVPASERLKLQAFNRILAIADAVPEDGAIIRERLNKADFSQGVPSPQAFVRWAIFDSPDSQISSGISDATQEAIAAELGIDRPELSVVTGSEMNDVFDKGVGTRTVRDPKTGELREEPIFLEPGEFEPIGENQSIGLTDSGQRAMRFGTEVGDFVVPLPENATAEDMVMYGLAGQMITSLQEVNMSEIFFPGRSQLERGGGVIDIRMPGDFNRTQQLSQIFFDNFSGYDGELLSQTDLDRIPYLMQFQNEKGDAVIGDVNPDQMLADYRRQGVLNKDDTLNWERFATMIEANRNGLFFREERYGRDAQQAGQ